VRRRAEVRRLTPWRGFGASGRNGNGKWVRGSAADGLEGRKPAKKKGGWAALRWESQAAIRIGVGKRIVRSGTT
jgi:hypothetical protein